MIGFLLVVRKLEFDSVGNVELREERRIARPAGLSVRRSAMKRAGTHKKKKRMEVGMQPRYRSFDLDPFSTLWNSLSGTRACLARRRLCRWEKLKLLKNESKHEGKC